MTPLCRITLTLQGVTTFSGVKKGDTLVRKGVTKGVTAGEKVTPDDTYDTLCFGVTPDDTFCALCLNF